MYSSTISTRTSSNAGCVAGSAETTVGSGGRSIATADEWMSAARRVPAVTVAWECPRLRVTSPPAALAMQLLASRMERHARIAGVSVREPRPGTSRHSRSPLQRLFLRFFRLAMRPAAAALARHAASRAALPSWKPVRALSSSAAGPPDAGEVVDEREARRRSVVDGVAEAQRKNEEREAMQRRLVEKTMGEVEAKTRLRSGAGPSDAPRLPAVEDEIGGPTGSEPTRYGDWERKGRVSDF